MKIVGLNNFFIDSNLAEYIKNCKCRSERKPHSITVNMRINIPVEIKKELHYERSMKIIFDLIL